MSNKIEVDTKTFMRFWLVLAGLIAIGLFLYMARTGLLIVGTAIFLAIALNPLISKISKHMPSKSRTLATLISYILVIGVIGGILWLVVPIIVSESVRFAENMPGLIERNADSWSAVNSFIETHNLAGLRDQVFATINNIATNFTKELAPNIINSVSQIASGITALVLILVLTFLILVEGPTLYDGFWAHFKKNQKISRWRSISIKVSNVVSGFVGGQLVVALIDALVSTLAVFVLCLIFGAPTGLALPLGVITGTLSLIPLFGAIVGGVIVAALLAFNVPIAGLIFIIFFIIYQQVEANIIAPKVQSKRAKLPPLIILVSITIGIYLFGLLGAIVAVPLAGCIKVLFDESTNATAGGEGNANTGAKSEPKTISGNAKSDRG
ncbi:MAG: AI-2E family transporter [Candidatus Nomurabacteria bacterium]|jgi:predicted PurR-regulated permease PerM|nr:AI-2E family transporter [Candidatus Nomurabacteria bacterium]